MRNRKTEPPANQSFSTRRQFLKLPKAEKERILREQVEEMVDFYESDTE